MFRSISFLINESLISAMSAVEDQQEQDQQEQQFHHSQIYTKCVNRKTVLYAVWSYKCSFVLQSIMTFA